MNTLSRTITGIIAIFLGLLILKDGYPNYILSIYGLLFIIVGVVIFLNKKEDDIEKIKTKAGEK